MIAGDAGTWLNQAITSQPGVFQVELDATPSDGGIDAVVGLSDGRVVGFSALAAIVRFNPIGIVDVFNFNQYRADVAYPWTPGTSYHLSFRGDLRTRLYSVAIRPTTGGTEVAL